jgi:hypothetical protein
MSAPTPEAEKAALAWLDYVETSSLHGPQERIHAAAVKTMLAEPRMPAEPTAEMIEAMVVDVDGWQENAWVMDAMRESCRALYAHLSKPATRTVEVWRVEWAAEDRQPRCKVEPSKFHADSFAEYLKRERRTCIKVTGPHSQEVPA